MSLVPLLTFTFMRGNCDFHSQHFQSCSTQLRASTTWRCVSIVFYNFFASESWELCEGFVRELRYLAYCYLPDRAKSLTHPSLTLSLSTPCSDKLVLLSPNTPSAPKPLPNTILPVPQHTVPSNVHDSHIGSFFLFRRAVRPVNDTLQHPHRLGLERRRPCTPFRTWSRRGRDVESVMFKETKQIKWLPIWRLSVEMFSRLCDSIGKDRKKIKDE